MTALDDFLASYQPAVRDLALGLRTLIRATLPALHEYVDAPSRIIAYGDDPTYRGLVCAIAPQQGYVNLMFTRGTELPDPDGLLQGTGKRARHVKLTRPGELADPALANLLKFAAALQKPA